MLPLCPPHEVADPDGAEPPASFWLTLLVPDHAVEAGGTGLHACTGEVIERPPEACGRTDPLIPIDRIDDRELVFGDAGDSRILVWARTHQSASGDAFGPIALVAYNRQRIAVEAIGLLEAPPHGAVLSLVDAGDGDGRRRYLVAEGERCRDGTCAREARIAALDGLRFVPSAYYDANARCVEPPGLPLLRRQALAGGGTRSAVDRRLVTADATGLYIHEELEIFDGDQLIRSATEVHRVDYEGGHLVIRSRSLWSRVAALSPESTP